MDVDLRTDADTDTDQDTCKCRCRWWSGNSDIPISKGKSCWMWQEAAQIASSVMHRRKVCIELSRGPCCARSCLCSWQRSCVSRAEENVSINCAISQLPVFMWLHWRPRLQRSSRTCDADCPPPSLSNRPTTRQATVKNGGTSTVSVFLSLVTSESLGSRVACDEHRKHGVTAHDARSI